VLVQSDFNQNITLSFINYSEQVDGGGSEFVVADLKRYHRGWLLMADAMTRPGILTSAVPYLRWRSK